MKTEKSFALIPVALAVAAAFALHGCGGSGTEPVVPTATVVAPVVNSPLKDVTVTLSCADGSVGGSGIAAEGSVSVVVPTTCAAPFTMAVSGTGTMAGPDLKFGTDDDEAYDSATRTALKSVIQDTDLGLAAGAKLTAGASVNAPSITSLTTMIAEKLAKANPSSAEIDAAKTAVAGVTGLLAADLYKNPMSNGEVFKAATLVNEMVASAMKADPTKKPADLIKTMAASTTAKLTDTTIDPAAMMGMSAANAAIMQAQMATMQAKADAMKSVADAVTANVESAKQAGLTPADAGRALAAALAGGQAGTAAAEIAKAKAAQDAMKQMAEQMDKLRADTSIPSTDLAAKMTAMVQGLDAVRVQQESNIQDLISKAGTTDPAAIQAAMTNAMKQAGSMIAGSAPALLSSIASATVASLQTSGFMSSMAGSITSQIDPAKMADAMATAGGDPTKALQTLNLNPTTIASTAATTATQASGLKLTPPAALSSFPALAEQVVGMVVSRAANKNYLGSTNLQAWVDAIGTALAKNSATALNPGSVGEAIGGYFFTTQPDLTTAPGTLTLTIGAAPTFTQSTTPITVTPPAGTPPPTTTPTEPTAPTTPTTQPTQSTTTASTSTTTQTTTSTTVPTGTPSSSLPLCPELQFLTPPVQPQIGVNCRAPA